MSAPLPFYDPHCTLCPLHENAKHVCIPMSGLGLYRALIVGEAPGRNEDEQDRPFVGQAGRILDKALADAFITENARKEIAVTNAVKCRPVGNVTPTQTHTRTCVSAYLTREIASVDPRYILALGNVAAYALLGHTGIANLRGLWHRLDSERERYVRVTWHPAYLLYQGLDSSYAQEFRADVNEFAGKVIVRMGEE